MSKGVFRNVQDVDTGGGHAVSTPNGSVYANGNRIMVVGSFVGPHPGHDQGGRLEEGSGTVFAEKKPIGRKDDPLDCGHKVGKASEDVFCGD